MDTLQSATPPALTIVMHRAWAMPSPATFTIAPIADLLDRWLAGRAVVVDPFSGQSTRATWSNDLNPALCAAPMDAAEFCLSLAASGVRADVVLFDPPYSPRQITEVYKSIGRTATTQDTQNAALYKRVKDASDALLVPGGIAICCGWNSSGFGKTRGYDLREILLVAHGGAHNDTIVTVEVKR